MIIEFLKRLIAGSPVTTSTPSQAPLKETKTMTKVLVLYYSSYGHIETMANAVAEGAKSAGAEVVVKRVPELVPEEVAKSSYFKMDQAAPIATVDELADYDAIIVGAGTRFGTVASQMRNFWDQTGGLWFNGKLVGKVGSAFTSSATQHGGQESTLLGFLPTFLHHGMVVAGLPYAFQGQMGTEEVKGGSPYGATTITNGDGSRQPSEIELEGAKFQGAHVAKLAAKLKA
ncbi:NAD(P)H dehydrogenase (quinone) [Neorhizobium alkalisoli]|jgi:NAD(P)H dehydrogenase (quinone)|uniref:NAD(P)H dehydrogenase (quinone) n=2 Tax=Neorhizobium alkalisoli TaxID=528178 RepID=A0A561R1I9_9HYPH|nr:NAD(P)H dehydrogenase (quinone) [Neorhizobium alkalisoli]